MKPIEASHQSIKSSPSGGRLVQSWKCHGSRRGLPCAFNRSL